MPPLAIGVRTIPKEFKIVDIEDFDFDKKVDQLKEELKVRTGMEKDSMELVYCGNILEDDMTIEACKIKGGVMVHLLKKKPREVPVISQPMSEQDIKALVIAFRTLIFNPPHRNSLQKLSNPDVLDNIIQVTPGLINDPVAISLIQDPDLMVRLASIDTMRLVVEQHPALAEAANHIAATVHEEALHNVTTSPTTSAGYSHLDILSDDEDDMESSQSSDSLQPGVSRQPSFSVSGITPAQLAAALASAQGRNSGNGSTSESSGGQSGVVTAEMVNEAVQQVFANFVPPGSGSADAPSEEPNSNATAANLADQLQQMRELGLSDDVINLQALQVAGGDLVAALELVFSGAIGPDPPM